jgi:hypothetical protein
MPFQSEKQRRYLWANEPEIARDWTDTYGSGIHKALGGRIGFFKGAQADTASGKSMSPGTSASGGQRGEGRRDHHPPAQPVAHTVAPTVKYDDRIQRIAAQNKRTTDLRNRAGGDEGFHQFITPRTNYQKPTLGMRLRSGLGALGRGIGHVARNFNPISFAFDNPLMKLLMSRYGQGNIRNLFQRNTQDDGEIDYNRLGLYTDTISDAIGPGKRVGEDYRTGIMSPDILPEPKYDNMFDNTYLADVSQSDIDVLGKYAPNQDVDTIRMIEQLNPTITDQEIIDVLQKKITSPTGKFA